MVGGIDAPFSIVVMDADDDGCDEFIGAFTTSLRQLSFGSFTYALKNPKKLGRTDKTSAGGFDISSFSPIDGWDSPWTPGTPAYSLSVSCKALDRKSLLSSCNTFFEFRTVPDARLIFRSEVVPSNASPNFKQFDLPAALFAGNIDQPLAVGVKYDDGEPLGAFITTVRDLSLIQPRNAILNPKKKLAIPSSSGGLFQVSAFAPNPSCTLYPTLPIPLRSVTDTPLSQIRSSSCGAVPGY